MNIMMKRKTTMTEKIKTNSVKHCQSKNDEMLAPSLRRFVKMVKSRVINQSMSSIQSGDMIQNAENIERKLLGECGNPSGVNSTRENRELCLDPILHHRVLLSTGIAKSFATGNSISHQRMKILRSNIEYIENSI